MSARQRNPSHSASGPASRRVANALIHHAARSAPPALAARLEEEWLADLRERRGAIASLRFALGCCWATHMIARDHGAVALAAAAGSGSPPQGIAWRWGPWALPRRSLVLIVIVVLHGALILGLANGLARVVAGVVDPHTTATVIERPTPLDHPVPVPEPTLGPHTIPEVPIPDYPLAGSDDPDGGLSAPRAAQPTAPAEGSASIVHRVAGGPARGFPSTQDYYPPAAIRAEEQGGATVNVCVDAAGRLTGAPSLVQSSGSTRLDEGALRLAQAGSGHYRPTTEDGRPVSACYPFRITFTLNP